MKKTILISIAIVISLGHSYQDQDERLYKKLDEKLVELVHEVTEYGSYIFPEQVTFDQVKDIVDLVITEQDNISQDKGWKYHEDVRYRQLSWNGEDLVMIYAIYDKGKDRFSIWVY